MRDRYTVILKALEKWPRGKKPQELGIASDYSYKLQNYRFYNYRA